MIDHIPAEEMKMMKVKMIHRNCEPKNQITMMAVILLLPLLRQLEVVADTINATRS